jgi:23S rRNA pseudouridine955/2504/2580 synthase
LKRLFLHAERLEFPHPEDRRRVVVEAPLPGELVEVLARAGLMPPETS